MSEFPPPSGSPVPPSIVDDITAPRRGTDRPQRRTKILVGALVVLLAGAALAFVLLNGDDEDVITSTSPTTAPTSTSEATEGASTTTPSTVNTAAPAPTTAAPSATTVPATVAPVATTAPPATAPPATAPPATAPPATTMPPAPTPPWWDMTYTLDCGTGPREFTLVNGFFEEVTLISEFYFELSREVYPLADGSVVLKGNCYTGGGAGVTLFILGLPDGTATSPVVLPKNSIVSSSDGVTLTVDTFNDTMQPPPLATSRLAVVNGQLVILP